MYTRGMPTTLDKPAGLPVFPPHAGPEGDCLLKKLLADQPWRCEIVWPEGFEGGISHRLDNSTSGAILVADNLDELRRIRDCFHEHRFTKTYLFLAAKDVPWDENACDKSLSHDKQKRNRMTVQRGRNTPHRGQWYPAKTSFRRVCGPLFEATMSTGVMHQIRVHAAFLGIPILGDKLYGGGPTPHDAPRGLTFFLHHVGLIGPQDLRTKRIPTPPWADRHF